MIYLKTQADEGTHAGSFVLQSSIERHQELEMALRKVEKRLFFIFSICTHLCLLVYTVKDGLNCASRRQGEGGPFYPQL